MRSFVLREPINRSTLYKFLDDPLKGWEASARAGKPLQVDIGPEKTKRSGQQNKLYWSLLQQVSDQVWIEGRQYHPMVFHELARRRFIGCLDLPGGGMVGMSTTDLSPKEFGEYVDQVTAWAAQEFGVTFLEPDP